MNTKQTAERAARKALKRMRSPGWEIRVSKNWQNLGWRWSLVRPGAKVCFDYYDKRFWGQIEPCLASWSDNKTYLNPNDAYCGALHAAKKYIANLLAAYSKAAGWTRKPKSKL